MSYSEIHIAELEKAQSTILEVTHIHRDQYTEIMFTHGSMFAEYFSRRFLNKDDVAKSLLEDKSFGFWRWWKTKWLMDDAALIRTNCITPVVTITGPGGPTAAYEQMKACMIGDQLLEKQLFHQVADLL